LTEKQAWGIFELFKVFALADAAFQRWHIALAAHPAWGAASWCRFAALYLYSVAQPLKDGQYFDLELHYMTATGQRSGRVVFWITAHLNHACGPAYEQIAQCYMIFPNVTGCLNM
jgi:hypothetical protein